MTFRLTTMTAAMAALALTPACAESKAAPVADREAMEQVVREYILENPEIIEEALIKLSAKQQAAASQEAQKAIASNFDAIYNNENDYFIGPADAEITVVEFFDYRCGWCKRSVEWIQALPEDYDGNVRVVFKEVARDVGMNVQKMRADMGSIDIQRKLSESKQLARAVGVEATPSFLIGNEFIEGANRDRLNEAIKAEIKG